MLHPDGCIVRVVCTLSNFGSVDKTMPAVYAPLVASCVSRHVFVYHELILVPDETEVYYARADIGGYDQIYYIVG
jgi:hypothetical protein